MLTIEPVGLAMTYPHLGHRGPNPEISRPRRAENYAYGHMPSTDISRSVNQR